MRCWNLLPWSFSTDHLRQVNRSLQRAPGCPCESPNQRPCCPSASPEGASPDTIAKQWFIDKGCNRLLELLDETDLPDRMVVACCAWLETRDVSHGAHLLHHSRTMPKHDFADFKQTPEEREADLRFANFT